MIKKLENKVKDYFLADDITCDFNNQVANLEEFETDKNTLNKMKKSMSLVYDTAKVCSSYLPNFASGIFAMIGLRESDPNLLYGVAGSELFRIVAHTSFKFVHNNIKHKMADYGKNLMKFEEEYEVLMEKRNNNF